LIHLEKEDLNKLSVINSLDEVKDENKAYILERKDNKVRELVINKKVFSKIYDGLYTKIVCDYNLPLELPEVDNYEPA